MSPGLVFDQDPLTWLLRSYDLVKHDLVSPDFIIAPIDPNIKKNIIENTFRPSLFSVKPGVGDTLTVTLSHRVMTQLYFHPIINSNRPRSKTWLGLVSLDYMRFFGNICKLRHPCNQQLGHFNG